MGIVDFIKSAGEIENERDMLYKENFELRLEVARLKNIIKDNDLEHLIEEEEIS